MTRQRYILQKCLVQTARTQKIKVSNPKSGSLPGP